MFSSNNTDELELQLKQFQQQKSELEKAIENKNTTPTGTADFGLYQMKKKRSNLKEQIGKINSILHPNIIA